MAYRIERCKKHGIGLGLYLAHSACSKIVDADARVC